MVSHRAAISPKRSWPVVFGWIALALNGLPAAIDAQSCLECHGDEELVRETDYREGTSVFVDEEILEASVHEGMECVDCHADAEDDHPERLERAQCSDCHEAETEEYASSLHGQALERGVADAPACGDCHGGHDIRPADDPQSAIHRQRLPYTCAHCHADVEFVRRRPVAMGMPLEGYTQSEHYRSLMEEGKGATCADCHEAHALYKPSDPRSAIHHMQIPATCGQCHGEIREVYGESIHGKALAFGNTDSPDCVDCHGEHEIRGPKDPQSTVYPAHIARTTCTWCHESERIVRRYGLAAERLKSYADSYHGLADRGGSTTVANCASCHGIHDIRPSRDPRSSIHPANLPQTCGQCHPGAGANFALGPIHVAPGLENGEHPVVHFVRRLYLWLIAVIVGAMALHNGLDFARKFRMPRLPHGRDFLRFTLSERLQHGIMALSFIVLAYSGFALKFPEAWWAAPFEWIDQGEQGRRLVHRGAALAMVGICLCHLGYLGLSRRGREQLLAMRPRVQDLRDAAQMVRYWLGRSAHRPAFDRFGYVEKIEYWALVWGSLIMTATGFALWFENISLRYLPKWGLDLATVVHYYEAWLATLAILVWHFYWVIFNPAVYPMSLVWLTGRLSEEEMAHEHPRELDRLQKPDGSRGACN